MASAIDNAGDFESLTEKMQALYHTLLAMEKSGHEDEFEAKVANMLNDRAKGGVIGGKTTGSLSTLASAIDKVGDFSRLQRRCKSCIVHGWKGRRVMIRLNLKPSWRKY